MRRGVSSDTCNLPIMLEDIKSADFRLAIEELLKLFWDSDQTTFNGANQGKLVAVHGLIAHSLNMAEAGLLLMDQDRGDAAKPLARVALEHAVTAQWVHLQERGVEGLAAKVVNTFRKIYSGKPQSYEFPSEVDELYAELQKPENYPKEIDIFEQMCNDFNEGQPIYPLYRILSGSVHPGNFTLTEYIVADSENGSIELLQRSKKSDPTVALHTLTIAVVLAMGVYEDIRQGKPNEAFVREIANKVGLSPLLTLQVKGNPTAVVIQ